MVDLVIIFARNFLRYFRFRPQLLGVRQFFRRRGVTLLRAAISRLLAFHPHWMPGQVRGTVCVLMEEG